VTATSREPNARAARRRLLLLLTPVILLVIGLASSWSLLSRWLSDPLGQPAAVGVTSVVVDDDRFTPSVIAVPVGTTVTFTWADGSSEHNVVFDDGQGSEIIDTGTYERQMTIPGDVVYRCTLHPFMDGMVQVRP
jgi:plastocyanin